MVEFNEDLSVRYTGTQALTHRILYRLKFEQGYLPFCLRGVNYGLFTYGRAPMEASVRYMLQDLGHQIVISDGRMTLADIRIDLSSLEVE